MRSFSNHFQQFTAVAGIVGSVFRIGSGGKQLPEKFKISFRTVITVANQGAQGLVFLFVGSMFDQGFRPVVMAIAATLHRTYCVHQERDFDRVGSFRRFRPAFHCPDYQPARTNALPVDTTHRPARSGSSEWRKTVRFVQNNYSFAHPRLFPEVHERDSNPGPGRRQ